MPLFGTEEWTAEFKNQINANEAYAKAGSSWVWDFMFIIRAEGNLDHDIFIWIDLFEGKCRTAKLMQSPDEKKTEYDFEGVYSNWVKVIKGEMDPIKGLLAGHFKLRGDMARVLKAVDAANELVNSVAKVDSQFY